MPWCLVKDQALKFKQALKDGRIDPFKMAKMTSEERHKFLGDFVGKDNATQVNALFESKLLLKNQKQGYITWAKRTGGMTPQAKRDIISRIEKMDKILNPEDEKLFLEELASKRLGVGITVDEAKALSELSEQIKPHVGIVDEMGLPTRDFMIGAKNIIDYVQSISPSLPKNDVVRLAAEIAGVPRALMSTADFSASFRQAVFFIPKHPILFAKAFNRQFSAAFTEKSFQNLQRDIQIDPFFSLTTKGKTKLAITDLGTDLTKREEAFLGTWLEKVPVLGYIPRASSRAYTALLNKFRFDIYKSMVKSAHKMGRDVINDEKLLSDIHAFINNGTGRGGLGRFEGSASALASGLFSPRLIGSRVSLLNPHYYAKLDPFVRKEALKSLFAFTTTGATILALAKLNGAEVETDLTSADTGKIKIGRTRFDIWGGFQQYVRLAAQIITNQKKSTTTGEKQKLGEGFNAQTRWDVALRFFEGKAAPVPSYIISWMKDKNWEGEKFDPKSEAIQRMIPFMAQDLWELYKQDDLDSVPSQLPALFGVGVQTYNKNQRPADWETSTSKKLNQFKDTIGKDKFNQANNSFNEQYNEWYNQTTKTAEFEILTYDERKDLISSAKEKIRDSIFKEYDFEYEREETPEKTQEITESLLPK